MSAPATLVWFRLDLRTADHLPLATALARGGPVVPVFIWAPDEEAPWAPGAASRWWLHHSLHALDAALRRRGSRLVIRRGPSAEALARLARESGATAVAFGARVEPAVVSRDGAVGAALRRLGVAVERTVGDLLFAPDAIRTRAGGPFQVFTPFWRACLAAAAPAGPVDAAASIPAPAAWPDTLRVEDLELLPRVDWAAGLRAAWTPGEDGAAAALARCVSEVLGDYAERRDRPDLGGTSRLSPHLHFGEVGPRQVWAAVEAHAAFAGERRVRAAAEGFLRQLGWREFAYHVLAHFPHTTERPLREAFARFPWRHDGAALHAWRQGRTGFPIVDAGMRELWASGWMHNRVRMIAASFLVKDLLLPWQEGARWFWDTLVDADLPNNTLGWQWAAGCGADAAPYFRIFNPARQGARFDPDGRYVRRWVPAQEQVPPMVDHAAARERALAALGSTRRAVTRRRGKDGR